MSNTLGHRVWTLYVICGHLASHCQNRRTHRSTKVAPSSIENGSLPQHLRKLCRCWTVDIFHELEGNKSNAAGATILPRFYLRNLWENTLTSLLVLLFFFLSSFVSLSTLFSLLAVYYGFVFNIKYYTTCGLLHAFRRYAAALAVDWRV